MKTAVSISLGSSRRDKEVVVNLLGEEVRLRREGFDGDTAAAAARYTELDGQVDAFGAGGVDLWVGTDKKRFPLRQVHKIVAGVKQTPIVDGGGLKNILERQIVPTLIAELGPDLAHGRALITSAVDRFGMTLSFYDYDYDVLCGDLGFGLGIPIAIHDKKKVYRLANLFLPFLGYLPMSLLYPTGAKQNDIEPRFEDWYSWADVIAGDCNYIRRHLPDDLTGKIIATNTTTAEDRQLFQERGVTHLLTTTPLFDGRSFGTNMLEAGLVAATGYGRPLTNDELQTLVDQLQLKPTLHHLKNHAL